MTAMLRTFPTDARLRPSHGRQGQPMRPNARAHSIYYGYEEANSAAAHLIGDHISTGTLLATATAAHAAKESTLRSMVAGLYNNH